MYKKLSLLKRDEERSDGGSSNEDTSKSFKLLRLQPLQRLNPPPLIQEEEFKENTI